MIKNLSEINFPCQYYHHSCKLQKICLNKYCKQNRLCCLQCIILFHKDHPENLIEIDHLLNGLLYESSQEAKYPQSYTYGQCQMIQNFKELLIQIDEFQKFIKEEIEKLKQLNLQQLLNEQNNDYQGSEYLNKQILGLVQYFEFENNLLTRKDYQQGLLSKQEQRSVQKITQAKDSLKQIFKLFENPPKLKFKSDPIKLEGHQFTVHGVVISSDGAFIASGSSDKTVKLWNAKTQQLLLTLQYSGQIYGGIAIFANNQYLAYGGSGDRSIRLHNIQQNKVYGKLKGHFDFVQAIAISHDSQFLFSGGFDEKLISWNLKQKVQIHCFQTQSIIWTILVSPDNKLISCICAKSINIWDFRTKEKLIQLEYMGRGLCSSKDSSMFISSGDNGLIKIWKFADGENNQKSLTLTRKIEVADIVKQLLEINLIQNIQIIFILTSDEKYIISICNRERKIMIHEIESGDLIQELKYEGSQKGRGYISISNDMNVLVSGDGDKIVKIWTRE